ncbi:hypothetical protein GCM10027566_04520 [Arachidicoccus ginsenosidivorans]
MMGASFVTLIASAFFTVASAQNTAPQKVKDAFAKDHTGIMHPKWELEDGNFEGNWKVNGTDHSALYSPAGKFIMSEADIAVSKLPKSAIDYMAKSAKKKVKEASKNVDADGIVTYEADVKNMAYVFDANGKFIKTVKGD